MKLGFIGTGKITSSVVTGICRSKVSFKKILLSPRNRNTARKLKKKTGYSESQVIKIMRKSLKPASFRLWRKRVHEKSIKHRKKFEYSRKQISGKIKKGDYL